MNSEIRVYRQKKVDQLIRNLERCNKILENIQKIDTYIQQQGGSAEVVTNLIDAVTDKQREMRNMPAYTLPENTQIVKNEDIQKQNEIITQFKTLATAVSKLVNTRVKAPTGPSEASQDPFTPLDVEFKSTEVLEAEYKEAVRNGNERKKTEFKAQLMELDFDENYFTQVQREVTAERARQEESQRQGQGQSSSSTVNVSGPESQNNNPSNIRQTNNQTSNVTSNVSGSQSQTSNVSGSQSQTSNVSGSQSQTSNTSINQRTTTNPQGTGNQTPRASNQTPGTGNQAPRGITAPDQSTTNLNTGNNKYFYQNYY